MITAIPKIYISKLGQGPLGIGSANPWAILEHLITTFGTIKKSDLALNLKMISTPWNPDEDIEKVFTLGDYCRKFAKTGKDPISDTRYIQILLDIFTASGARSAFCPLLLITSTSTQ